MIPGARAIHCEFVAPFPRKNGQILVVFSSVQEGVNYGGFVGNVYPKWMTGSKGHVLDPVIQKPP